jgi:hypothetical protein
MSLDSTVQRITENMDIDELAWYLEERAGKEAVIGCLMPLIRAYRRDLEEDYPWLK